MACWRRENGDNGV